MMLFSELSIHNQSIFSVCINEHGHRDTIFLNYLYLVREKKSVKFYCFLLLFTDQKYKNEVYLILNFSVLSHVSLKYKTNFI